VAGGGKESSIENGAVEGGGVFVEVTRAMQGCSRDRAAPLIFVLLHKGQQARPETRF